MLKRVILPTIFSLIFTFLIAGVIYWIFNGFWFPPDLGDGNRLGYDWLISEVAAEHVGEDDPSENINYALGFIFESINFTILYGYCIVNFFIFFWLLIGKFLKVDKPGIAKKYMIYWFIIALLCSAAFTGNCYYWLYLEEGPWYLEKETIRKFSIYMFLSTFILFLIQSWLFTSRVMYVAVPFVGLIRKITFRKN